METNYVSELIYLTNSNSSSCWFDRCSDCGCDNDCERDYSGDYKCYDYCDKERDCECEQECDYCSCNDGTSRCSCDGVD